MFKGKFGNLSRTSDHDYGYLSKGHGMDEDPSTWLGKAQALYRNISRLPLWKPLLPWIAAFLSLGFLLQSFTHTVRYVRSSGMLVPPYKSIPPISQAQIQAANNRRMTMDQCISTYPGLYEEADRAASYWEKRGGITLKQVEKAADRGQTARILIYNGEMFIKRFEFERHSRTRAALYLINEAITYATEPIPNVEFVIHTDDKGEAEHLPIMVLDRTASQPHLWLMPDYGFNSWPEPKVGSYKEVIRKAREYDSRVAWKEKVPQLFWKGAFMTTMRKNLFNIAQEYSWARIEEVDWRNKDTVITMDDHCGYKYLAHLEGFAYSGRLKYILQCKSVVVSPDMEFIQHFHHLINGTMGSPEQNMVIIPGTEWKTLASTMEYLVDNDSFAEKLAEKQRAFWSHYISKQSVDCYWRYLFQKWAELQRYTPELHYEDTPYESFNLIGRTHWDPY